MRLRVRDVLFTELASKDRNYWVRRFYMSSLPAFKHDVTNARKSRIFPVLSWLAYA